jgi:hypothetical protein
MTNTFDYYQNPKILKAIHFQLKYLKGAADREDCRQEIFSELYDFMPLDDDEAVRIVNRVGCKYRGRAKANYQKTVEYRDYNDWANLGDGCYERKAHRSPAD